MGDSGLERNKDVVRQQLAAMEQCDGPAQGALMTDDVRWWVPQSAEEAAHIPRPSTVAGRGEAPGERAADVQRDELDDRPPGGRRRTGGGRRPHAGPHRSGHDYLNQYVFVYRLVDGLIAEIWENLDTAYVFARLAAPSA